MNHIIIIFFVLIGISMDCTAQQKTTFPDTCKVLEDSISILSNTIVDLTTQVSRDEAKFADVKKEHESLQKEHQSLKEALQKVSKNKHAQENKALKKQLQENQKQLEELATLKQAKKQLEEELKTRDDEAIKGGNKVQKLEKELRVQQDNYQKLRIKMDSILTVQKSEQKKLKENREKRKNMAIEHEEISEKANNLEKANQQLKADNAAQKKLINNQSKELALLKQASTENEKLANIFFPELVRNVKTTIQQSIGASTDLTVVDKQLKQLEDAKRSEVKLKNNQINLASLSLQLSHFRELYEAIIKGHNLLRSNYNGFAVRTEIQALKRVQTYAQTAQQKEACQQLLTLLEGFCEMNNIVFAAIETAEIFRTDIENAHFELDEGLKAIDNRYLFLEQELNTKKKNMAHKSSIKEATCPQ